MDEPVRILAVCDDGSLAEDMAPSLRRAGYVVDCVASCREAEELSTASFKLVALNLSRPDGGSTAFLRQLRARGHTVPALVFVGSTSVEERVELLDNGADDVVAKPFALAEIEARVRALMRRGIGLKATKIEHGPLVLDATGRAAYLEGRNANLSAREIGLLEMLLQRVGRTVTKDQIGERLGGWGSQMTDNSIEVYVHRLRRKLSHEALKISTIKGMGYCLERLRAAPALLGRGDARP
jgi:two-component system OmpR family response regulator